MIFFSFENLANLILANQYDAALVVMPFVCIVNATTNSALSVNSSIKLLEIAYEFIRKLVSILNIPHNKWKKTEQKRGEKVDFLTVLPKTLLRRLVPTLVSLIFNLKMFVRINVENYIEGIPENVVKTFREMKDFGIVRLTTHPEENFNGFLREASKAQDKVATIMRIVARSNITKNFLVKHGMYNILYGYLIFKFFVHKISF